MSVPRAVFATATGLARLLGLADSTGGLAADIAVLDQRPRLRRVMKSGDWIDLDAACSPRREHDPPDWPVVW
jgi:hypothetical protein